MEKEEPFVILWKSCAAGRPLMVAASLINAGDKRDEILLKRYTFDRGNCESYTPFLLAVYMGHVQVVWLLLTQFNINFADHHGVLSFGGNLIEDASPLWCAAACGYVEIVKLLVEHGANVNETTTTNSTPLRAACFLGNTPIVDYLIKNGADAGLANHYNNTCLMVAAFRGNLEVVELLLSHGVDMNTQANCGGTALHFACDSGKLNIVEALVKAGCDLTIKNNSGLTAAMVAADTCQSDIIEYFIKQDGVDAETEITLLELLGASYANDRANYSTEKTYHYLYLAMLIRNKGNCFLKQIEKKVKPATAAYDMRVECRDIAQLREIHHDQDLIHLESLMVRERILGTHSVELIQPIVYRGAVYADRHHFDDCIRLWKRAIYLRQMNHWSASNDLLRFAEVFSQMYMLEHEVKTTDLLEVMQCCIEEIKTSLAELKLVSARQHLDANLHTLLYLLLIVCKTVDGQAVKHDFGKMVYQFLKFKIRDSKGSTLLHLAVDETTPVDEFHVKDICSFPNYEVTKFLLSCGADPNARNNEGNTPLHIIVQYERPISDFISLHSIISRLLDSGAHYDVANHDRKTPIELSTTGVAEIILKTQSLVSLKCIAARGVRNSGVPYKGLVPSFIEEFIELH
uniref:Uncharacterized protein n=1 Tax=Ciona savignyi TaxID=51511 RepID=H2Y4Z8_CIOSA